MAQGFIHDELDIKILVLYIMSRVAGPIDFATLTDLSMCDSGVDYFLYAQAVSDLVKSKHLDLIDGLYSVTPKGRENAATLESQLSTVVRGRCNRALAKLNDSIRRAAQVSAQVVEDEFRNAVVLRFADDVGPLMDLTLTAPSLELGERIAQNFRDQPEALYNDLITLLLDPPKREEP